MSARYASFALSTVLVALVVALLLVFVRSESGPERSAASTETHEGSECERASAIRGFADTSVLVGDCEILLAAIDELGGSAALNWSGDLLMDEWDGVSVGYAPARVFELNLFGRGLDGEIPSSLGGLTGLRVLALNNNQLTGEIPAELGDLVKLRHLSLHDNQLTGTVPAELGGLSELQALYLENNRLSGAIPETLAESGLRTLYVGGNSGLAGCIPVGLRDVVSSDLDRQELDYCAAGYMLTAKRTGVGSVSPGGTTTYTEGVEVTLTASWEAAAHDFAGWGGDCSGTAPTCTLTMDADKDVTAVFTALGPVCTDPDDITCVGAVYKGAPGDYAHVSDVPASALLERDENGSYPVGRGEQITVVTAAELTAGFSHFYLQWWPLGDPSPTSYAELISPGTTYTFTVNTDEGAPTRFDYSIVAATRELPEVPEIPRRPDPPTNLRAEPGNVVISAAPADPTVSASALTLEGVIMVFAAFRVETTTFPYDSYDTTGAVATPGSYAFLADTGDTTTSVTTYEALRDGTATGLLIHRYDTYTPQDEFYDTVAADDLVEWHTADDCWVRYRVTDVLDDPAGTESRRLLGVEWMTYAFTGCSGDVSTDAAATFDWGELPNLGGASLTMPVRHGGVQIVPEDWTGEIESISGWSTGPVSDEVLTEDIAEARQLDFWREPRLPDGWTLVYATAGGLTDPPFGYCAAYKDDRGYPAVEICGGLVTIVGNTADASWLDGRGARETRVIHGRPATVVYSPQGPNHLPISSIRVSVYDARSEIAYEVTGLGSSLLGSNVDAAIEIARSLYESPNPP